MQDVAGGMSICGFAVACDVEAFPTNENTAAQKLRARSRIYGFSVSFTSPSLLPDQLLEFAQQLRTRPSSVRLGMSQSPPRASDPTHFTQATPHASNKIPSTVKLDSRAPPNETPQEKVARLRERARRAKMAHISPWERVIERSRLWADRMHRTTVYGLIGFSGRTAPFFSLMFNSVLLWIALKTPWLT